MKVTIEGFGVNKEKNVRRIKALRIYATRDVSTSSEGFLSARPGTWQLECEVPFVVRGKKVCLQDFQLETTDEGRGPLLYASVMVDKDGREYWGDRQGIELPKSLAPSLNFAKLLLWNLERRGVIAPGQLDD